MGEGLNLGRIRDIWIEDDFLYLISNNGDRRGAPEDNDHYNSIELKERSIG